VHHPTTSKGDIGVALVTADLISQDCLVMTPVSATCPFDLGIIFEGKFYRVQVKYRSTTNGRVEVKPMRASKRFKAELNTDFDILAVYSPDVNKVAYAAGRRRVRERAITEDNALKEQSTERHNSIHQQTQFKRCNRHP